MSQEEIIERLKEVFKDKNYRYELVTETKCMDDIYLICPTHGKFKKRLSRALNGRGCPYCSGKLRKTFEQFKEEATKVHNGKYTYNDTNYVNSHKHIMITCPIHGDLKVTPDNFYHGHACSKCQESRIEREIRLYLEENNIEYIYECNKNDFDWLGSQHLDFYLLEYNVAIECQGEQHFIATTFGTKRKTKEECLNEIQKRDALKLGKCMLHGVKVFYYADYDYDFPYKVHTDKKILLKEIKGEN